MIPRKIVTGNIGDDTISIIDIENPKMSNKIYLSEERGKKLGPWDVIIKDERTLYILNSFGESLMTLDLESSKTSYVRRLGRTPISMFRYDSKLYILNCDSNSLSILDEKDYILLEEIPLNEKPSDIQIDRLKSTAYIACTNGSCINTMNLVDNTLNTISIEAQPFKIFLDKSIIYVLSYINNGLTNYSSISIIEPYNRVLKQYKIKGNFMDLNFYNNVILLTNPEDGYLYEFSVIRKRLKRRMHLGGMPSKLAIRGSILFINDMINDELIIIDLIKNKILERISVGKEPQGLLLL